MIGGKRRVPSGRSVAAEVLVRVLRDRAFAAAALDAELERNVQLEPRDKALATELVYGTLRLRGWLEAKLAAHIPRGVESVEVFVRCHLLVATYQVCALSRIPAFAAVDEAVQSVRLARGPRVAGFANAVLRRVSREPAPSPEQLAEAALASADPGLVEALRRSVGPQNAARLVSLGQPLRFGIRVEDATTRSVWIARFKEAHPDAVIEAGALSPHAIHVRGVGRLVDLPGYDEGAWTPQEEGSQVLALAVGARPGDTVLDACAGRGNKTAIVARSVLPALASAPANSGDSDSNGNRIGAHAEGTGVAVGAVDAADVHPSKLERLRTELARVGLAPRDTFAVDWSKGTGGIEATYDRVLVDAPCSGTGTLRRRPELLGRRTAADLPGLAALQKAIVARTAELVKPQGRLIYAVCSVLVEEAEEVVAYACTLGLRPAPFDSPVVAHLAGPEATSFRLLPYEHDTDGYFVASFIKA